jgi:hypothetical protein
MQQEAECENAPEAIEPALFEKSVADDGEHGSVDVGHQRKLGVTEITVRQVAFHHRTGRDGVEPFVRVHGAAINVKGGAEEMHQRQRQTRDPEQGG